MERYTESDENGAGHYADLVDAFVKNSRLRVQQDVFNLFEYQGRLEGLDICETLRDGQVTHFDLAAAQLKAKDMINHAAYQAGELSLQICLPPHYTALEVDYCYELVRLAHYGLWGEIYDNKAGLVFPDTPDVYRSFATELGLNPIV